ncbi:MAG: outer membrane beta-barrel protein [Candidatus Zixiibacteriota bacterium]|nr:MAG: outer membrane beta-barrel protein [candidate division Zixibacteria bacterium]
MKKLVMAMLLVIWGGSSGLAAPLAVGGFGGFNIPIVQDDQSSGTIFGLKGKIELARWITAEPVISFAKYGDAEFPFGTREGSKVNTYGIDLLFGGGFGGTVGLKMYGVVAIGLYSTSRDYDDDLTKTGWSTGLGLEYGFSPKIGLDLRGKVHFTNAEGGGTKKAATITGGLNYYFGN